MSAEAIEVLARCTANIMARDASQSSHLINRFKHALDSEFAQHPALHRCFMTSLPPGQYTLTGPNNEVILKAA